MKVDNPIQIGISHSGINLNIEVPINKEGFKGTISVQIFASKNHSMDLDYVNDTLTFMDKPLPTNYKDKIEWGDHYTAMFDKKYDDILWKEVKSILTIDKLKGIINKEWGENVVKNIKWELA